jgi:hypothetical protein
MVSSTALWLFPLEMNRLNIKAPTPQCGWLIGCEACIVNTERSIQLYFSGSHVVVSFLLLPRDAKDVICVCALPAGFTLRWRHAHTHSPRMLFTLFCFEFRYGQRTLSSARRETHIYSFPPANVCLFVRRLFAWRVQMQTIARHSRRPICGNTALCELSQLCGAWIGKINTEMNGRERNVKSVVFNSRCGWKVLLDSGKLEPRKSLYLTNPKSVICHENTVQLCSPFLL